MLRRRSVLICAGAFAVAAALLFDGSASADQPAELAPDLAAPIDGAVVNGAPIEGAPIDGATVDGAPIDGAPAGDCADGSCAGGGFGHPLVCIPRDYRNPHLFYSFYVGGNCGSIPAGMYPTPMPTPPLVGHTYFTYPALLPHEYMYAHRRVYHYHYNHNRGLNRTSVIYAW
jgi:hypothetical protein